MTKIALIGSAPSSVRLAPYQSKEWEIWGCSPGVFGVAPRIDAWFELHRYEPGQTWFSPEYCQWMSKLQVPVYMAEVRPEIPTSCVLPIPELVEKYGPFFFSSSLAYMFSMAMERILADRASGKSDGKDSIGLWGVDMAATEEYGYQRAGCQFFALIAKWMGIEVGVPPESDLFVPSPLYGVSEIEHGQIKLLQRQRELQSRLHQKEMELKACEQEAFFLKGALDDVVYMKSTWTDTGSYLEPFGGSILAKANLPMLDNSIEFPTLNDE